METIFLHVSGPNEQIYTHNEMSYVFNLGLITPLQTIVYQCFSPILKYVHPLIFLRSFLSLLKFSLIFMNMQMK